MSSNLFTARLLRTSASGFAAMAASRVVERSADPESSDFDMWQAHFQSSVLELAAAVDDGGEAQFARRIGWFSKAFTSRGMASDALRVGLDELHAVLEESMPTDSWAPLPRFFEAASAELAHPSADVRAGTEEQAELTAAYLAQIRAGDSAKAIELVVDALRTDRLIPEEALVSVVSNASRQIGELWHSAEINVAEEHFATMTTGRLLEQLLLLSPKPTANGRSVMLTMVEGDAHDLGLRVVAALFELNGWRTICLGANTPAADLAAMTQSYQPDLLVIGATLNTQREAVGATIEVVKACRSEQLVLVGGPAFSSLEGRGQELGADECALDPRDALRRGNELLGV